MSTTTRPSKAVTGTNGELRLSAEVLLDAAMTEHDPCPQHWLGRALARCGHSRETAEKTIREFCELEHMYEPDRIAWAVDIGMVSYDSYCDQMSGRGLFTERFSERLMCAHPWTIVLGGKTDDPDWPNPPDRAAYRGLAGDIAKAILPHSEADPVALLVQVIIGFGNIIGRTAYFMAEADTHFLNMFGVLVGKTSKARKGSSWGHVRRLCHAVDPAWADERVLSGLSSGEGLIWNIRDPIVKREPIKNRGKVIGYQEVEADPGVADKRLLAFEPEYASTLRVLEREGNTLSPIIRQAWERGDLRVLTKNSPAKATGAHISIIGHITADELRRYLPSTEIANGFINRFVLICVKRSKCLPEGGAIHTVDFAPLVRRLAAAVKLARGVGEMRRDDEAAEVWRTVYPELSSGKPGLIGAVTSRAEAQVMRLACVYALLDCSAEVKREHLESAIALWEYAEESARFIFGDALGDPVADEILAALRATPEGLTRKEISEIFGRHRSKDRIEQALGLLQRHGRAKAIRVETGGRPAERWLAT